MKNFKHYLFAVAALVVGFAFSACQPDTPEEKPAQASVQINVASVTASGALIEITTQGVNSYAYIMNELELPATAIYGGGTVVDPACRRGALNGDRRLVDRCGCGFGNRSQTVAAGSKHLPMSAFTADVYGESFFVACRYNRNTRFH